VLDHTQAREALHEALEQALVLPGQVMATLAATALSDLPAS
jgi:hypothetical protein